MIVVLETLDGIIADYIENRIKFVNSYKKKKIGKKKDSKSGCLILKKGSYLRTARSQQFSFFITRLNNPNPLVKFGKKNTIRDSVNEE